MLRAITFLFIVPLFLVGEIAAQNKPPTTSRGHYKQLAAYSKAGSNPETDKQKFPFDEASAKRRLELNPIYLTNVTVADFKLPDMPANSSEQTRAELNYLLGLQTQRTKLSVDASLIMAGIYYSPRATPTDSNYHSLRKNLFFIGRSMGTWFRPDSLPVTATLMANVWRDASYFIWSLKYKYLLVRPYVLEPQLKNLEETDWAAYPSGHAANSYINAYIFSEFAPEFADVFVKDAYDMAHSREILGVHYPSDSEASRIFACQFVNKLFENKQFKTDFENAKKEWQTKGREKFIKPSDQILKAGAKASSCSKTCN
jgi:acid phosphatase (class A)